MATATDPAAERFRRVAGRFSDRVREVPPDAWDNPAPCEGWVARDVVGHMVEWMPGLLRRGGVDIPAGPPVDDDPAGAWTHLAASLQALLDDPEAASRQIDAGPAGRLTVEAAIDMLMLGDVLVHTWDLARATGLDESLDPDLVSELLAGMQPMDELLRQSGHFGPKVAVPDDADDCTKLIAFTGRQP
jgi:uncharacterized protein (TIGR03086 family)